MPKFNKWLSTLLRNKEKLKEIAITTVNAECSAIILNKVPEKLEDPGKFLIPCALQELDRTNALADSGASINLLPHSIYKQLGLGALIKDNDRYLFITNPNSTPGPKSFITWPKPKSTPGVKSKGFYQLGAKKDNLRAQVHPVLLNTPLSDKVECSDPEDNIDEIDAFLAMEVSSNFKEGYFDSEGDVIFLENLLSDDTTHNLAPEVISDHEPKQNESIHNTSITFSPRSDPLHHEFAGELITLPSRIAREHEEYLSRMTLLCEISTSRSQENVHANPSSIIESLPVSLIPVEDSDPVQEEIDIFLVPDDLIPPGVENNDSEDEDNELPNFDHQDNPSSPRPPPEPPDVVKILSPFTAIKNDEDFNQEEIVLSLNVEDVNSFTFVIWTFLPFFTYPEDSPVILSLRSEDLIFDLGLFVLHFSYLEPVVFSIEIPYSNYCSP
ncbi:reverse transcriptase domain-containing protein [Tanacetum coccineum]